MAASDKREYLTAFVNFVDKLLNNREDFEAMKKFLHKEIPVKSGEWSEKRKAVVSKILPHIAESEQVSPAVRDEAFKLLAELAKEL